MRPATQPMTLTFRSGTEADLDTIVGIMNSAFDPLFGEAWTRSQCAGILPMSGVVLTVALANREDPVGFSLHRAVADEAELLLLAVNRSAQHRGIGRTLLEDFLSKAHAGGVRKVHLEVRENNPAVGMYRAAGFRFSGRRPDYYSGGEGARYDALTFVKHLIS